jgi:hypothetical protein
MPSPSRHRRLPFALVALLVGVSAAVGGGAVALATSGDEPTATTTAASTGSSTSGSSTSASTPASSAPTHDPTATTHEHRAAGAGGAPAGGEHAGHPALAAYADRVADASARERDGADELRDDVRTTLAAYADVEAAIAAGYRAPRSPRGPTAHYFSPAAARDGAVLDPTRPEGLVYYTVAGQAPVLLGAFFVAPRGVDAPTPAGDLVVWHSHDPACGGFFATTADPCTGTRRMLHVWTVDTTTLFRRTGVSVDVRVTDPFGAPFGASVARA